MVPWGRRFINGRRDRVQQSEFTYRFPLTYCKWSVSPSSPGMEEWNCELWPRTSPGELFVRLLKTTFYCRSIGDIWSRRFKYGNFFNRQTPFAQLLVRVITRNDADKGAWQAGAMHYLVSLSEYSECRDMLVGMFVCIYWSRRDIVPKKTILGQNRIKRKIHARKNKSNSCLDVRCYVTEADESGKRFQLLTTRHAKLFRLLWVLPVWWSSLINDLVQNLEQNYSGKYVV